MTSILGPLTASVDTIRCCQCDKEGEATYLALAEGAPRIKLPNGWWFVTADISQEDDDEIAVTEFFFCSEQCVHAQHAEADSEALLEADPTHRPS